MEVFVRATEQGSLSGAARELGISPALASKYLGLLEAHLGVRLLARTTRKLHLTDEGRAYLPRAAAILAELDDLEGALRDRGREPQGVLRISGPRVFGEAALAPSVARFLQRYPKVRLELELHERTVDIVGEGFDLAVRIAARVDSSLIARRICAFPYRVCASRSFLERYAHPEHPEAIRNLPCIVTAPVSPDVHWAFRIDGEDRRIRPRVAIRTNTGASTACFVRAGLGIGLCLHATVATELANGSIVELFAEHWAYDREVFAVYPSTRQLSPKVRAFVDHLVEELGDRPLTGPTGPGNDPQRRRPPPR